MNDTMRRARLEPPTGKVRMVLDTDTYNEIDDQFAVVQTILSPDRLGLEAIYAAPFHNDRSEGPGDGMEKSYEEILRLLERLEVDPSGLVHRGSTEYLTDRDDPERSDAVSDLIDRALAPGDEPLYVVAVGAITNVASAILLEPRVVDRVVVVWLGGQPHRFSNARDFNLQQDYRASRMIFDCGVPLVHIPCSTVASELKTTIPEVDAHVRGRGVIGDYLADIFADYCKDDPRAWSKVIWDISGPAWILEASWVPTRLVPSPVLEEDWSWREDSSRHLVREATHVKRDPVFRDLFEKIEARAASAGAS